MKKEHRDNEAVSMNTNPLQLLSDHQLECMVDRYLEYHHTSYLPYPLTQITAELMRRHGEPKHQQATKETVWQWLAYQRRPHPRPRLALVLAVLLTIAMLTIGAIAVRPVLFGFLKESEDTLTAEFQGGQLETTDPVATYPSLADALAEFHLYGIHPNWIPARFSLDSVAVQQLDDTIVFLGWYISDGGDDQLSITVTAYQEDDLHTQRNTFEIDGSEQIIYAGGVPHYMDSNYDVMTVQWENGNCLCSIRGDVSENELEKMIASIYE